MADLEGGEFSGLRIDDSGEPEEITIPVWESHLRVFELFRMLLPQTYDGRLPQEFTLALCSEFEMRVSLTLQQLQALLSGYSDG